jgi:hypothetical protein
MRLRRLTRLAIVVAVLLTAVPARAADPPTLAERAAAIEDASTRRDGIRIVVGHISRELGIPVDTLRAQRAQTGLNWGEIFIAHHLARQASVTFDQVVDDYRSGKSWEDIARDRKADPARLSAVVQKSQSIIEQRGDDRAPPPMGGSSTALPGTGMVPRAGPRY